MPRFAVCLWAIAIHVLPPAATGQAVSLVRSVTKFGCCTGVAVRDAIAVASGFKHNLALRGVAYAQAERDWE